MSGDSNRAQASRGSGSADTIAGRGLSDRWALAILFGAVAVVYGGFVFTTDGTIVTHRMGDGGRYFIYMRGFLAEQWTQGRVPLWNPHVFAGTPFAGVFQSAVFYPPGVVYLLLPLATAFNVEVVGHTLLIAGTTYLWQRGQRRSPEAALVAAALVTFGATFSLRVLAGQLSVLDTFAWVPLLLWALDRHLERPGVRPMLWAGLATTMILLAGHPPTAFMVAVGVALYAGVCFVRADDKPAFAVGLASMVGVALLLAGVHLAAGFETAREATRNAGVSLDFATSFSLPPESLLTYLVPNLFGGADAYLVEYAGRWWYWDDVAHVGVVGVTLAVLGLASARGRARWWAAGFALLFLLLAMGGYTPLFPLLHGLIPGFDLLRAPSKFLFGTTLALGWLAALGVDALRRTARERTRRRVDPRAATAIALVVLAALAFGLVAFSAGAEAGDATGDLTAWLARLGPGMPEDPKLQLAWARWVAFGLQLFSITSVVLGVLLMEARRRRGAVTLIVLLAVLELAAFARANRGGVPWFIEGVHRQYTMGVYRQAGDDRVLELGEATSFAMSKGGHSVWGYDPVVLERTTRFMAWTQGLSADALDNVGGQRPTSRPPALAMLRTRYAFDIFDPGHAVREFDDVLPHFLLVGDAVVRRWPDEVFETLGRDDFDPRALVVLEQPPVPAPSGDVSGGRIRLVASRADRIDLDVDLASSAVLLVTDAWANGWRARSRDGDRAYALLPADGMLRAVPLEAGRHRLRLEYAPAAIRWGWAATGLGGVLALAACGWALFGPGRDGLDEGMDRADEEGTA